MVRRGPESIDTPHGACVLFELDPELERERLSELPLDEQAHAARLGAVRRREFIAGRHALHHALGDLRTPILADDRGAPRLPAGYVGSVSHKGTLAAALVARADAGWVGVDLERAGPPRLDISRRILTPREQAMIPDLGRPVTLRFSIKEAIYKAVDPHVRRYVAFTEVELDLDLAGDAVVVTSELPLEIEASWREHAGHWLTTARARLRR